ncbi:MAG: HAD-IA family hydrolase [Ignavibacteria bacterium]|nr:HAD-IA family hydrolase [Ignavibacteria bacterium]
MIKNIIIDFGNVIYKVDLLAAHKQFFEIAKSTGIIPDFNIINTIIDKYECGKINTAEFRDNIRGLLHWAATDEEFDFVWNSILIEPFEYSEEAIHKLSEKYNLYLLSNTSPLHYEKFSSGMKQVFNRFNKLYFSFEVGYKKPSAQIYKHTLIDAQIIAQETIFLDDIQDNIDKFSLLGVQGIRISENFTLKDFAFSF